MTAQSGNDTVADLEQGDDEQEEQVEDAGDQGAFANEHTAAVVDEADVEFWDDWDPRRAPKGDYRRRRMSKGVFLFACAWMHHVDNMNSIFAVLNKIATQCWDYNTPTPPTDDNGAKRRAVSMITNHPLHVVAVQLDPDFNWIGYFLSEMYLKVSFLVFLFFLL